MAKTKKNNVLLYGVSGSIGKTLVVRQTRHGVVLANRPSKPKRQSERQKEHSSRFLDAVRYAREQMRHWEFKSMYQTAVGRKVMSAYQAAVTDYLKPPIIHRIETKYYTGAPGQQMEVLASDDFKVASVELIVRDPAGEIVERGAATRAKVTRNDWVYFTTAQNIAVPGSTIEARARDMPGNVTSMTVTLSEPFQDISKH
jgi:hypothetical protein